ncbi:MAG: hypothetical protein AAF645_19455 [Myxococcota bacterium]
MTSLALDCNDDCKRCRLFGPVLNANVSDEPNLEGDMGSDNQRCLNDTRFACRTDADCEGIAPNDEFNRNPPRCRFIQGPPLSLDTGGRPACTLVYFVPPDETGDGEFPVEGTIDLETGVMNFERFHVRSTSNGIVVVDGEGNVSLDPGGVCGECLGDTTPGDGVADGLCAVSERGTPQLGERGPGIGQTCDQNGVGSILGGSYSFDCPTTRSADSVDFDLRNFGTSGRVWRLNDPGRPECSFPGLPDGTPCWCGVCDNDTSIPCADDGDCGGGSCGAFDPEQIPIAPNNCRTECIWNPDTARGTCEALNGPAGELPPEVTLMNNCFPAGPDATIAAPGRTNERDGVFFITLGTLNCLASSASPDTNQIFGLPGPALYTQQYQVEVQTR